MMNIHLKPNTSSCSCTVPRLPRSLQSKGSASLSSSTRIKSSNKRLQCVSAVAATEHLTPNGHVVPKKQDFSNANFPTDVEGNTYHLGTKKGEVANRILSVGSIERAKLISTLFDSTHVFKRMSSRGFLTITGQYHGVPISIVSTQMGMPNMDFVIRENRAVVDGQMAVVRFGTCGALQKPAKLGSMIVASEGSVCVRRDPDAFTLGSTRPHYSFTLPVPADAELSRVVAEEARKVVGEDGVVTGLNATADSFYSSQGRVAAFFDDRNENVTNDLLLKYPEVLSLEMETFHLFDLARCSRGTIRAAAFCIALAERYSNKFLSGERTGQLEMLGGAAALSALCRTQLEYDVSLKPQLTGRGTHVWDYGQ